MFRVHIAPRPGAEKDDMLEAAASNRNRCWQRRVIDDRNLGIAEHVGKLIGFHLDIAVNRERWISRTPQLLGDGGERLVSIDKNGPHKVSPSRPPGDTRRNSPALLSDVTLSTRYGE